MSAFNKLLQNNLICISNGVYYLGFRIKLKGIHVLLEVALIFYTFLDRIRCIYELGRTLKNSLGSKCCKNRRNSNISYVLMDVKHSIYWIVFYCENINEVAVTISDYTYCPSLKNSFKV